jgi:hypothetical protein
MASLRNLVAPFQRALIAKRLCPGCTISLDKADRKPFTDTTEMAICACRRMFVYDIETDSYRRATVREAEIFAKIP